MPKGTNFRLYCAALAPYTNRPLLQRGAFDRGLSVEAAALELKQMAQNGIAVFRDSAGARRKPLWSRAYIEARIAAACFAVIVEAETHRLEPDGVEYVRDMKKRLLAAKQGS